MVFGSLVKDYVHYVTDTLVLAYIDVMEEVFRVKTFEVLDIATEVKHCKGLLLKNSPSSWFNFIFEDLQVRILEILSKLNSDTPFISTKNIIQFFLEVIGVNKLFSYFLEVLLRAIEDRSLCGEVGIEKNNKGYRGH